MASLRKGVSGFLHALIIARWIGSLVRIAFFVTVLGSIGYTPSAHSDWSNELAIPSAEEARIVCDSANFDPWQPGSTPITPGSWANFRRSGTGWTFVYNVDRTQMRAILYTFTHVNAAGGGGRPIWLATGFESVDSQGNWKAQLRKYTATSATTNTSVHDGWVAIRIFPNDATKVALRWSWSQLDLLPGTDNNQLECIQDFNRIGPDGYETPRQSTITEATVPVVGPNTAFTGYWNEQGASSPAAVPGTTLSIFQNTLGDEVGVFTETHGLTTFDAAGQPVWLSAQKTIYPAFTLPPWNNDGNDTYIAIPSKVKYPQGVPVNDCLMWQPQPIPLEERCWTLVPIGTLNRQLNSAAHTYNGVEGAISFTFASPPPSAQPHPFNWPGTPQVVQGAYFWPSSTNTTIRKTSSGDGIHINQLIYQVGVHTYEFFVNWNSVHSAARAWRHDLNTNAYSLVHASGINNGFSRDPLPGGSRVQYELWLGQPNQAGSTLLDRTPEGRAYAAPGPKGDSSDGPAETPPQPAAFAEPSPDASSDAVGAVAGEFSVDQLGNANYRIPVVVPPGRGGMVPQFAIAYSSGGGDGYLGTGFALSGVSAITACRPGREFGDAVEPTFVPDQFCLDGQRLILTSGTHRQLWAEYRAEIDGMNRIVITSIASTIVGGASVEAIVFTVYGKDGSVRHFGGPGGVAVTRQGIQRRAIAWQETDIADAAGNQIQYAYSSLDDGGERYLTGASYVGGNVAFSYQPTGRADISYSAWGPSQRTQLMTGITVYGTGSLPLRHYQWEWKTPYGSPTGVTGQRPRISQVRECNKRDTDPGTTVCYQPLRFTWQSQGMAVALSQGRLKDGTLYPGDIRSLKYGDFDGDGRQDIIWASTVDGANPQRFHIAYSRPTVAGGISFGTAVRLSTPIPDNFEPGAMWEIVDLDNDGRDDIIYAFYNKPRIQGEPTTLDWFKMISGKNCDPTSTPCFGPPEHMFSIPDGGTSSMYAPPPARAPEPDGNVHDYGSSLLSDIDGDGQADLVIRGVNRNAWVSIRNRDSFTPFDTPVPAVFYAEDGVTVCQNFHQDMTRKEESHTQAMDFDGDGRSDIRAILDGGTFSCLGQQTEMAPPFNQQRLEIFRSAGLREESGGPRYVFQRYMPFGDVVLYMEGVGNANRGVRSVDINGDGLTDLVYMESSLGAWMYRLNGQTTASCVADCTMSRERTKVQVLDFDGDGKQDFWFPLSISGSGNNVFKVYLWNGNGFSTTPITSQLLVGDDSHIRAPMDLDGDGNLDWFYTGTGGRWTAQRTTMPYKARGVITRIDNGLGPNGSGALTDITYAPLTFSSVYRRDYSGPSRGWHNTSPVFDIAGPSHVVQRVQSSAPVEGAAAAQSEVVYRYAGLKIQSGGRGSLGFRRVSSVDMQTGIEIDTWYDQEFPLTGTAWKTWTRKLTSTGGDTACGYGQSGDSTACMTRTPYCAGGASQECDSELPGMANPATILKEGLDEWVFSEGAGLGMGASTQDSGGPIIHPTLLKGPYFVARQASATRNFDPTVPGHSYSGSPTHYEETLIPLSGYDAYGNPTISTVVQSGGGATVTTESRFEYANTVSGPPSIQWKLGRLLTSKVKVTRTPYYGNGVSLRQSSFSYDARGLLTSERVDAMTGTFPHAMAAASDTRGTATYYKLDGYGNREAIYTCSTSIPEATCRASSASGGGGYVFHPAMGSPTVQRYSKVQYDGLGRFPVSTTEVFSNGADSAREVAVSTVTAFNDGGDPLEVVSANGAVSKIRYGALGRKYFEYSSTGVSSASTWSLCSSSICPSGAAFAVTTVTAGAPDKKVFQDVLGRPVVAVQSGFQPGSVIASITRYDARGNVVRQSDPFFAINWNAGAATLDASVGGNALVWTEIGYDHLNRQTSSSHPGAGTTTISYAGLNKTTTLPANKNNFVQTVVEKRNGSGEVVEAVDANALVTGYEFDAAGNATRVSQDGRSITMLYDGLGRKIGMVDPDMGSWQYHVNDAGEVFEQISGRGTCTRNRIDGRGRVWLRTDHPDSGCSANESRSTWAFDTAANGIGALASESSEIWVTMVSSWQTSVARTPAYDGHGRPAQVNTTLRGKTYQERSTYDQFGRPFQSFFKAPDFNETGERTEYTGAGYAYKVRSAHGATGLVYSEVLTIDARGQITREKRLAGAQITTDRGYDVNTGRLKRISTAGGYIQDLWYDYDALGNVDYREDRTNPAQVLREEFTYDRLQRLLTSTQKLNGTTVGAQAQSYHGAGNVGTKTGPGTFSYGTKPSACNAVADSIVPGGAAVSATSGTASPGQPGYVAARTFCYNANGSVVKVFDAAGDKDIRWTSYEQASSIRRFGASANRVDFVYGPGRERLARLDFAGVSTTPATETHTVGTAEVRYQGMSEYGPGSIQEVRRYLGGLLIVQKGGGATYEIRREYFLTDAQGSTYAVLDDFGMPINASARMAFDPWGVRRRGEQWTSTQPWSAPLPWSTALRDELLQTTRKGYTGHEQLDGVGVIHMGGRIYDPELGRFLQADPFIQSPGNSQSYNRYTYVFNNPLAYTDPTGYWGAREQAGLRTVVAIVIAAWTGYYAAAAETWGGTMAWAAAGGFAAGAVQSGNLRGATTGAISAMAFAGIGRAMPLKGVDMTTRAGMAKYAQVALISGFTGGVMAEVQGGRFGNGFVTAGANVLLSPVPEAMTSNPGGQIVVAAVIGGTISEATGGNFGNGAVTAAFQAAASQVMRRTASEEGSDIRGDDIVVNRRLASRLKIHEDGESRVLDFGPRSVGWSSDISNEEANEYIRVAFAGWNTASVTDGQHTYSMSISPVMIGRIESLSSSNADIYLTRCVPNVCKPPGFGAAEAGGRTMWLSPTQRPDTPAHELGHIFGFRYNRVDGIGSIMGGDLNRRVSGSDVSLLFNAYRNASR